MIFTLCIMGLANESELNQDMARTTGHSVNRCCYFSVSESPWKRLSIDSWCL